MRLNLSKKKNIEIENIVGDDVKEEMVSLNRFLSIFESCTYEVVGYGKNCINSRHFLPSKPVI